MVVAQARNRQQAGKRPGEAGYRIPMSAVRRTVRQIVEQFQPEQVILFGSYAYGVPNKNSDIDLLVVLPARDEQSRARRIAAAVDPPFKLDLHVRTPENLRRRLSEGDWFLCEVVAQGQVLHGKLPSSARWAKMWFHRGKSLMNLPVGYLDPGEAMKKSTADWVRKAEADWVAARRLGKQKPIVFDVSCFCCQQTVEKYFKALLNEEGAPVPRTHDLDNLLDLLLAHDATLKKLRRGLKGLTLYAVEFRYPGFHANARQVQSALRRAERARREIRVRLGLPLRWKQH